MPAHPGSPGQRAIKRVCVGIVSVSQPCQWLVFSMLHTTTVTECRLIGVQYLYEMNDILKHDTAFVVRLLLIANGALLMHKWWKLGLVVTAVYWLQCWGVIDVCYDTKWRTTHICLLDTFQQVVYILCAADICFQCFDTVDWASGRASSL